MSQEPDHCKGVVIGNVSSRTLILNNLGMTRSAILHLVSLLPGTNTDSDDDDDVDVDVDASHRKEIIGKLLFTCWEVWGPYYGCGLWGGWNERGKTNEI